MGQVGGIDTHNTTAKKQEGEKLSKQRNVIERPYMLTV